MITNIYVEGEADKKYIKDYIEFLFNIKVSNNKINETGGWTKIASNKGESIRNSMKKNTANGENNIVIFDADENPNQRRKDIEEWKTKFGLAFKLFLFPDNKSQGELEDLLEHLIPDNNLDIFECWKNYENCIKTKSKTRKKTLTIPAKKSKIYCYVETLVGTSNSEKEKIKDRNRDFLNAEHWQLDSANLLPLKEFLIENIK